MEPVTMLGECFVITPIGEKDSPTRKRTNTVIEHLIQPAIEGYFESKTPHEISEVGTITMQIIDHIVSAPLLIADLTDNNPNVYYELAIRHAVSLPAILMIQDDQFNKIPFDLKALRTVRYDLTNIEIFVKAKAALRKMVEEIATDYKAPFSDIVSDTITLMQIPENPKNKVFLGTLMIASMVRFDLIDKYLNFFQEKGQKRYDNLQKAYSKVLRISSHEKYLEYEEVKEQLFSGNIQAIKEFKELYAQSAIIVKELGPAITRKDDNKIESLLRKWDINNSRYFHICLEAYQKWIDSHLIEISSDRNEYLLKR